MTGSVKLFSFNQKLSHAIGISPIPPGRWLNSKNWIAIIISTLWFFISATFFFFGAKSMFEYGISFYAVSVALFPLSYYLAMVWRLENTFTFIDNLERFIEKRQNSINVYQKPIKQIELLSKLLAIAIFSTLLLAQVPPFLYTLFNYYILDLGEESFFSFFPLMWPFDRKTLLIYSIQWLIQTVGIITAGLITSVFFNSVVSSCWLLMLSVADITKDLETFNNDVRSNENRDKWSQRLCGVIQLYSDVKELLSLFNSAIKYSLFLFMLTFLVTTTCQFSMLHFQLMDDNTKPFEILIILFGVVFILCELGERLTIQFDMFLEELQQCDWYELPMEMQRKYLIFLSDSQQPKYVSCYPNILCTRETFKKTVNTSWSYFATIRQIEV